MALKDLSIIRIIMTSATVIQAVIIYLYLLYFIESCNEARWYESKVFLVLMFVVLILLCVSTAMMWIRGED